MITIRTNGENKIMFDMTKIGKKIKTARTEKNMTQMDLADAMGISFQAVSNWERGNSMPDIAKLPELCQILDLNMDDLMGNDATTNTVKKIISDDDAKISLEELAQVAPIVPPKKMEQVFEEQQDSTDEIDINALIALAPFLDEEYLDALADKVSMNHFSQLAALAPFLEDETINRIALNYDGPIDNLSCIASFLEEETLGKLALRYEGPIENLKSLAVFMNEDDLDILVDKYLTTENCNVRELVHLAPFLNESTVRKIADYCIKFKKYDSLSSIAPFM